MTIPSFIQHSRACSNCWIWAVWEKSDPEPGEIFCQLYNTFVVLFFDSWELPNPIGLSDHHCLRIIRFPWKNYIDCHWVEELQRLSLCWTGPQQFSKASFCRSRGVSEETIDRKITSLHIFFLRCFHHSPAYPDIEGHLVYSEDISQALPTVSWTQQMAINGSKLFIIWPEKAENDTMVNFTSLSGTFHFLKCHI